MKLPKHKLPKGTSHLKFKKHKKSVNHIDNEEVQALKAELKLKEIEKKIEEEKNEQNMDEETQEKVLTEEEKLQAKLERKKERRHRSAWKKHTGMGYNTNKNGPRAI